MSSYRRALISAADKQGLADLAKSLHSTGTELVATGGTARLLATHGIEYRAVEDCTGFPEILDGRVKTLHPKIHGGILARGATDSDELAAHQIEAFDLVIVNLYPFEQTIADPECSLSAAIEQIDIGGVALLRAAAKNFAHVTVVVDPRDYPRLIQEEPSTTAERRRLAVKAFSHTARYDSLIASYLDEEMLSEKQTIALNRRAALRYGENPHQQAALYRMAGTDASGVGGATQLGGSELSYNNLLDADGALRAVVDLDPCGCVIVKHATPCGAAVGVSPARAYRDAYAGDPEAAFGGIIAFNVPLDAEAADAISEQFAEVILAPDFSQEALALLRKKQRLRILQAGKPTAGLEYRSISGGILCQERDATQDFKEEVVTTRRPTEAQWESLRFAWRLSRHCRSNAIVAAHERRTVGIGSGQVSRVGAMRQALRAVPTSGAVVASDGFLPFADNVELAAASGVVAIVQPGGSKRDSEVIAACNEHGLAMVMTGIRHFRH